MEREDIERLERELAELPRDDVLQYGPVTPSRYTDVIKDGPPFRIGHPEMIILDYSRDKNE